MAVMPEPYGYASVLTRAPAWIEVLAAGQSAQVRATVPLGWGYRL